MGPGEVALTHHDTSSIGEVDGKDSDRIKEFGDVLRSAGFDIAIKPDIMSDIWKKFLLNCGINALCAVSGLRTGEIVVHPEFQAIFSEVLSFGLKFWAQGKSCISTAVFTNDSTSGYIEPMGVHSEYRRIKPGTALAKECFKRLRNKGIEKISIACNPEPDVSNFLYESLQPASIKRAHRYTLNTAKSSW